MENPWDLLLNTGNHPKGYSSFNKTPFPWLLLLPVPCQDFVSDLPRERAVLCHQCASLALGPKSW